MFYGPSKNIFHKNRDDRGNRSEWKFDLWVTDVLQAEHGFLSCATIEDQTQSCERPLL